MQMTPGMIWYVNGGCPWLIAESQIIPLLRKVTLGAPICKRRANYIYIDI